jgi:hypothetical protein
VDRQVRYFSSLLDPVPASAPPFQRWQEIPRQSFVEVPQAQQSAAVAALKTSTSVSAAADFVRDGFACPAPQRSYLIRALYENHDTGVFQLFWADSLLIVMHSSLGPARSPRSSVLVACLAKAPSAVYGSISGAL